jgi:hypothetical protein
MKSPAWLRRAAMGIVLWGLVHLLVSWPMFQQHWAKLSAEEAMISLYTFLATGLWMSGSGFVLGFLAEAGKDPENIWPGPFARGVTNLLLVGATLQLALLWSNPASVIFFVLAASARWCARKA